MNRAVGCILWPVRLGSQPTAVSSSVSLFRDTCNVYVLRAGTEAVLVDFGDGDVLEHLDAVGVERVTDVLLTHHHRDSLGGLRRAVDAGIRVWAPPYDAELIADATGHWLRRPIDIDYDLRQDRFSLLESVPIAGTVAEYVTTRVGGLDVLALPTPGHTPGSLTYFVESDGRKLAFTGDLVYGDGMVWSLAATQWSYSGVEGQDSTIISCAKVGALEPDVLLPSHGEPIEDPPAALSTIRERLGRLIALRLGQPSGVEDRLADPFHEITPHLLRNRTTFANSYVLVSESGAALGIDFGYDMATWRRPLLWSLEGVDVEAVVVTHFHDDHVAGLNLIRAVKGAEIWTAEHVAPVLENPKRFDLPCLWPEPIPVDRALPLETPIAWREYELTLYPLPGHTFFACAIAFEVDGRRVVAIGDQYTPTALNYQYRNRFQRHDFIQTGELLRRLQPDLLIGGHFFPHEVEDGYLDSLVADAHRVAELHDELLPAESFGERGFGAWIEPYRSTVAHGEGVSLDVTIRNPFERGETAIVRLVLPDGWSAAPEAHEVDLDAGGEAVVTFEVAPGAASGRIAAELTVGETRFGQQAEAIVYVR
jgi:glyoxylase-like metal-dependent hydrolase (beta-lactamase superfamily II)